MIEPYYQDEWSTIYRADCRDVLTSLAPGMVVVTDQPYGTGWTRGGGKKQGQFKSQMEIAEWDIWDLSWLSMLNHPKRVAAFCPIKKLDELCAALPFPSVLYYKKTNARPKSVDHEPIVVSPPPICAEWKKVAYNGDSPFHPCQKPLEVMAWLINAVADVVDVVLDPFMGSGSTLVSAKKAGFRSIGIEINEQYAECAVRRLQQEVLWSATD